MSLQEIPKHVANVTVAVAPAASYFSGLSLGITIIAGIVSIVWMGGSVWKLFFPDNFDAFVKKINGK
jgi:hypothetical protein